jgi:hypothetical protein
VLCIASLPFPSLFLLFLLLAPREVHTQGPVQLVDDVGVRDRSSRLHGWDGMGGEGWAPGQFVVGWCCVQTEWSVPKEREGAGSRGGGRGTHVGSTVGNGATKTESA